MSRCFRHPLLAGLVVLVWLLLQQSLSPGTILLAIVLALWLSWLMDRLELPRVRVRNVGALLLLMLRVFVDIIRANMAVAKIILSRHSCNSGFVRIPLEITGPYALAALACIITATPGTIWVSHDSGRQVLTIHVLNLIDEAGPVNTIKRRYERPLLKILQ